MAAGLRFQVVNEAFKRGPVFVDMPKERPSEYFAKYVFNRQKMFQYLSADVVRRCTGIFHRRYMSRCVTSLTMVRLLTAR